MIIIGMVSKVGKLFLVWSGPGFTAMDGWTNGCG